VPKPLPTVSLGLSLAPKALVGDRTLDLSVNIETSAELKDATLEVSAPSNFRITPVTPIALPIIPKQDTSSRIVIRNASEDRPNDSELVVATVWTLRDGSRVDLASQTTTFAFSPEVSTWAYILTGALGVLLGHLVRLALRSAAASLETAQARPASRAAGVPEPPPPPWLVKWVHEHVALVDLCVSMVLGMMALLFLRFVQQPPLVAASIYWCVTIGFGIGLLASNDIVSRLTAGRW
jgi:hypothetical protein